VRTDLGDVTATADRFAAGANLLSELLPGLLDATDLKLFVARIEELVAASVTER
jgi:hypothetical protein